MALSDDARDARIPGQQARRDEPLSPCGVRELAEETGYRAAEWARAGIMHNAIAYSNESIEVWFARGLARGERQARRRRVPRRLRGSVDELEAAAGRASLTDAKTLVGLLWLQNWRAGRWPLAVAAAP